jgi:hypothetical protein
MCIKTTGCIREKETSNLISEDCGDSELLVGASCIGLRLQVACIYFVDDDHLMNLPFPIQTVQFKRLGSD